MDPTWLSSEKGLTSASYSKDNKYVIALEQLFLQSATSLYGKGLPFFLIKKIRVKFNFQTSTSDLIFVNLILYFKK